MRASSSSIRLRAVTGMVVTMVMLGSLAVSAQAQAQPPSSDPGSGPVKPSGFRVVGHTDLGGGGFNAQISTHRGYAYVGGWGRRPPGGEPDPSVCPSLGVRAVSLADPAQPELVSSFANGTEGEAELADTWTDKAAVQRFRGRDIAAVGVHNCLPDAFRGFGLWDVTDPTEPERLALVRSDDRDFGVQELWLERRGKRLYLYTTTPQSELSTSEIDPETGEEFPGTPDFQIWDVTRPAHPVKVGEWGAWAELGIRPQYEDENGVPRTSLTRSVTGAVQGDRNLVYVPYFDTGTVILDVEDPSNPTFLGRTEFEPHEAGRAHSIWLAQGGEIMIETSEPLQPQAHPALEYAWGYTRIYDISDPANPVRLAAFEMPSTRQDPPPGPGFWGVHDPKVRGNTLYLSYYAEGVVAVDISQPSQPKRIAQFVPPAAPDPTGAFCPGAECAATWGVDLHGDLVVASDTVSGLWVLKLRGRG
jgi:hypothetical protein